MGAPRAPGAEGCSTAEKSMFRQQEKMFSD